MPEGPSVVILKEQAAAFAGRTITRADGNTSIEKRIQALRSWGKHFPCIRFPPSLEKDYPGRTQRRTFYCGSCQPLYI